MLIVNIFQVTWWRGGGGCRNEKFSNCSDSKIIPTNKTKRSPKKCSVSSPSLPTPTEKYTRGVGAPTKVEGVSGSTLSGLGGGGGWLTGLIKKGARTSKGGNKGGHNT